MIWVAGVYMVMSVLTFIVYGIDKRRAQDGSRRIPERNLHLLELLGGWPGALIAQRIFRHKRQKLTYLAAFAVIILLHIAAWVTWWRMSL